MLAWNNLLQGALEVVLGLFLGPLRACRGQRLETKIPSCENVTTVAAGVSRAVLQENRLDPGFEKLEVEWRRLRGRRIGGGICWLSGAFPNPIGEHLPLQVVLRCPEFAPRMRRVSACLARQGMKQQPALHGNARHHQLGDSLEVPARLVLGPRRTARREWLQPQPCRHDGMTIVAAHTVLTFLKEDRLNASAVRLVVERRL